MLIGKTSPVHLYQPTRAMQPGEGVEGTQSATQSTADKRAVTDFSTMTRSELFDWMNTALRNGEMTLDESSPFLALTLKMVPDGRGGYTDAGLDDTERLDFLSAMRNALDFQRSRADDAGIARLERAMDIMHANQNRMASVDIRA